MVMNIFIIDINLDNDEGEIKELRELLALEENNGLIKLKLRICND
jgi:hypothetical protein